MTNRQFVEQKKAFMQHLEQENPDMLRFFTQMGRYFGKPDKLFYKSWSVQVIIDNKSKTVTRKQIDKE